MRHAFDRIRIIVSGRVMADGDNIRFELERKISDGRIVIRVCHHCCHIALSETKTGMPIPRNFHEKASGVNYNRETAEELIESAGQKTALICQTFQHEDMSNS
jgi:hypothetical protein